MLVAAGREAWEPAVLSALAQADMAVLRRCVDLVDLLGIAAAGGADVAVLAASLDGVDADALRRLRERDVRVLGVGTGEAADRLVRLGATTVSEAADVVPAIVRSLAIPVGEGPDPSAGDPRESDGVEPVESPGVGRVVAVWGPAGAPGRTTVATALAAEHALAVRRERADGRVVLCDLDPFGGAVAQTLGILDEVSGLLAAARAVNEGELDAAAFVRLLRAVGPGLEVLSGLPRADRWIEVRAGVVDTVLELAAGSADVVVDCGFSLEDDDRSPLPRHTMTLETLMRADQVVVVAGAEPVGLARLARGLVDLVEVCPLTPFEVVVNRMRPSLGWRTADIESMVAEIAPNAPVSFWPDDRAVLDRALVAGVTLAETGQSVVRTRAHELAARAFAPDQVAKSSESPATV